MGNQPSLQQLNKIKQDITDLYPKSDKDGDGLLNQEEFTDFLKSFLEIMGYVFPTDDKIKTLFTTNDSDHDGKLSRADIDKMLLPDGYENMAYDPNNQFAPQPDPKFNPFVKLDAIFDLPIPEEPVGQPIQNGAPVSGFPNQQLSQNPLNSQGQNPPNPLGLIANLTKTAQANEPQPVQDFMDQVMGGFGKAFQGLNLNDGASSNNQGQTLSTTGFVSGLHNAAANMISMAAEMTFDIFDLDEDGFIGFEDLETLMNEKTALHGLPTYSNAQIKSQMDRYDKDKDGKLNLEEYTVMMLRGSNFFLGNPVDPGLGGKGGSASQAGGGVAASKSTMDDDD